MDWFDDEEFWKETYRYMFPPERIEGTQAEVEGIINLIGRQQGALLDMCCGPGRHSVAFAQRGWAVTGVDKTAFLLDKARARAREAGMQIEWIQEDMRRFVRDDSFDLAINLFTSFGFFDDPDDDVLVLNNLYRSLKPGGHLVLDMMGKERTARIFEPVGIDEYDNGALMIQKREFCDDLSRMRNRWTLVKDGKTSTFELEHAVYSGRELKDRLLLAGFAHVKLFGSMEGAPFDLDAKRLVAVARK